jgi:hypothetical protein
MTDRIAGAMSNEDVVWRARLERDLRCHIGRSNIEQSRSNRAAMTPGEAKNHSVVLVHDHRDDPLSGAQHSKFHSIDDHAVAQHHSCIALDGEKSPSRHML